MFSNVLKRILEIESCDVMNRVIEETWRKDEPICNIKSELWNTPNIKFYRAESIDICDCCECNPIDEISDIEDKSVYVRDLTKDDYSKKIAFITISGKFDIVGIASTKRFKGTCKSCLAEMPSREEIEEGPYGGAFSDWDDFYLWKER